MNWEVVFSRKAAKQAEKLNNTVLAVLRLLIEDLVHQGSSAGSSWPHYGKLHGKIMKTNVIAILKKESPLLFVVGK